MRACKAIFLIAFSLLSRISFAQDTIAYHYQSWQLENDRDNIIQNESYLDDFFEKLYQLKKQNDRQISILHIGDSHIQGDYLTQPIRRNFQQNFGNAGRGLVIPGKVAGTNESYNIVSCSEAFWNAKRCVHPDEPMPIGIGGITVGTQTPNAIVDIYMNDLWLDYTFNKAKLFYLKNNKSFNFQLRDTLDHELGKIEFHKNDPIHNYSTVTLTTPVDALRIETLKENPDQTQAILFGISFENGNNGILYHAVGVNGAKYKHYNAAEFFVEQTSALKPSLIVISLGTNESIDYPHLDVMFFKHIEELITSLQRNNPESKFILVTPPDAFRQKTKVNPGVKKIRDSIIRYAVENGLAFYDMYKALGGEKSASVWTDCGFLKSDGIHFTKDGYEYQANIFFNAIIKSYNRYVQLRHP